MKETGRISQPGELGRLRAVSSLISATGISALSYAHYPITKGALRPSFEGASGLL